MAYSGQLGTELVNFSVLRWFVKG